MELAEITLTHWAYLIGVLAIVIAMVLRRGVVLIATVGVFVVGLLYTGELIPGIQIVFNSFMTAGTGLFDIMLVIALMVGMLKSMETLGADYLMVAPIKKLLAKPVVAFFVLGAIMYVAALFFWPTPATALVGVILIPVAVKAGLPAMAAAMSVNILGHGMALAGDMFLQGAPNITAGSADVGINEILTNTAILSLTAGLVAITVAFFMIRKEIMAGSPSDETDELMEAKPRDSYTLGAKFMAVAVPVVYIALVVVMVLTDIRGGASTALLGGTAALFIVISSFLSHGDKALERLADYLRDGLMFSVKIFAAVIPIAGFFFLGAPANAAAILGEGAPGFLFDLGNTFAASLPLSRIPVAFGVMITGVVTGLDGSGFSGLPLVGSLANALGTPLGLSVPVLAALGQVGAVFSGGGTITAWAFGLVATAGVAGVSPLELARKNFIPVMSGLLAATIVAILLM
ncbi:hypothetical protein [Dethiobacter alkaliphilus]|uniref:Citrate transporter n=1 Tax=Dethiobacter alkaliphilus AHT 1 TaxID=555088 RepID=C0GKQ7_DETAL|nr:hypothetical protein [Dethiobacter alkaliphilus]EEG76079.1 conserved hypothetical protein [Dethiobacter alkaliphilus AHT 1]